MSSYQAEYEGVPLESTSCSVPSWISVESVDRAACVDAAAADPDPVRGVLRLARGVLCGGRDRPFAADRAEQLGEVALPCSMLPWL